MRAYNIRRPSEAITVNPADDQYIAELLAYALQDAEPYVRLMPDFLERRDKIGLYFAHRVASGRGQQWLLRTFPDYAGIAAWSMHPEDQTAEPDPDPDPATAFTERTAAALADFERARREQHEHTMRGRKHEHLQLLCSRFEIRGLPVETALLCDHLAALDRQRVPAYADSSRTEIRDLLGAHGFRPAEPIEAAAVPLYPMVREPFGPGP